VPRTRRLLAAVPLAAALAAAPARAAVHLDTDPGLYPKFRRGIADYVVRCGSNGQLVLFVKATHGDRVAVGHHTARSGEYVATLNRRAGGGVTVHAPKRSYHIRCLPKDFPAWSATRRSRPQSQWYIVTPIGSGTTGYVAFFDSRGVPVWWRRSTTYGPWDGKLLSHGDVAWTRYLGDPFGMRSSERYEVQRLDGTHARTVRAVGNPTDTHDLQRMPNGHYLVISYRRRTGVDLRAYGGPANGTVWDGQIQELTPSGRVVWSWNSKNHVDLAETGRWWISFTDDHTDKPLDKRTYDLVHLNSVEPDGDGFVVSARHLDAVFRIDRRTKEITWKLGGTHTSRSLTVTHDPLSEMPFAGQHDARLYRDGTLTVYDNGTNAKRPPRAVRYRIDAKHRTAKLIESVADREVGESGFAGSARKLPGGDWVVCWGGSALVTEQKPSGKRVFGIFFHGYHFSYRAVGVPRGRVSARVLRRAMDRLAHGHRSARWR
jgi:Arylsulfotransferase (ASST)